MSDIDIPALFERVAQFERLELPGQPMGMHMGTMYLVGDLKRTIVKLQGEQSRRSTPDTGGEARDDVIEACAKVADECAAQAQSLADYYKSAGGELAGQAQACALAHANTAKLVRALKSPRKE